MKDMDGKSTEASAPDNLAPKSTDSVKSSALVTTIADDKSNIPVITSWLVKSLMLASESEGFLSAEIKPPDESDNRNWTLLQRYRTAAFSSAWKNSQKQQKLIGEFRTQLPGAKIFQEEDSNQDNGSSVATAIVTKVKEGKEAEYREWESEIQGAQARFPGFSGSYVQPPTGAYKQWVTLLRFSTPEALNAWFTSPERKQLIDKAAALVKSTDIKLVNNSFPGWFPINPETGSGPPNWKSFMLVLLGLYPIVMLELGFLMPQLSFLPSAFASFCGNVLSVAGTTWLTMPSLVRFFKWWLFPEKPSTAIDLKGMFIVIGLYTVEVLVLWDLLKR